MPNWCKNTLTISGDSRKIEILLEAAKKSNSDQREGRYDIGFLYPMPFPLDNVSDSPENTNWYDWRISHWGTKWSPTIQGEQFDHFLEEYKKGNYFETVTESFGSAWSPPTGLIARIAELFPELSFQLSYYETGMCFKVEVYFEKGEMTHQEDSELTWQDQIDMEITELSEVIEWGMASKEEIVAAGYATEKEVDEIIAEMGE